jgi:hypothetical protein
MLAILAAATVASAVAPPMEVRVFRDRDRPGVTVCRSQGRFEVSDPALLYRHDGKAKIARLGDLPKANHEKAVLRTVDGCAAPMVVGYGVGR